MCELFHIEHAASRWQMFARVSSVKLLHNGGCASVSRRGRHSFQAEQLQQASFDLAPRLFVRVQLVEFPDFVEKLVVFEHGLHVDQAQFVKQYKQQYTFYVIHRLVLLLMSGELAGFLMQILQTV